MGELCCVRLAPADKSHSGHESRRQHVIAMVRSLTIGVNRQLALWFTMLKIGWPQIFWYKKTAVCLKMSDFRISRSDVDGEDVTTRRFASQAPNIVLYQSGLVRLEHRPIEREISDVYRYESAIEFFKNQPVAAMSLSLAVESKLVCAYAIQHESLKQLEDARELIAELRGRIAELKNDKIVQKNDWDEHKRVLVASISSE